MTITITITIAIAITITITCTITITITVIITVTIAIMNYITITTCSLHCSSFFGLPFGILNIELVKPKKGTTMETIGTTIAVD